MFKKRIALILALLIVLAFGVACSKPTPAPGGESPKEEVKPVRLKMSITVGENSSWFEGATKFKELIAERTNGKYIVDIFPSEQLSGGNTAKGVEMVQAGATDLDIHSTIIWTAIEPKLTVVNMPWLIPSYEEADAALNGKGKDVIFELVKAKGVTPLALGESGFRQVTNSKRPIKTPADVSNLKLRVPGIKMYVDLLQPLWLSLHLKNILLSYLNVSIFVLLLPHEIF